MSLFSFLKPKGIRFHVEVKEVEGMGRGVFATKAFKKGELVVRDPVLVVPHSERDGITASILNFYGFSWPYHNASKDTAFALGVGSLFNHAADEQVTYTQEPETNTIRFEALRDIKKGEQLFVNYGYDPLCHQWRSYLARRKEIEDAEKAKEADHLAYVAKEEEDNARRQRLGLPPRPFSKELDDSDEQREEIDAIDHGACPVEPAFHTKDSLIEKLADVFEQDQA